MIKKFPLLYIAFLYIFSTKDKIIFFMHQFAILIISLSIAAIICSFSLLNGFNNDISGKLIAEHGHIEIKSKIDENLPPIEMAKKMNEGFPYFKIENDHIQSITYKRQIMTFITVNNKNKKILVEENPEQNTSLIASQKIFEDLDNYYPITILDPNSYNPMAGALTRHKTYKKYDINNNIDSPLLSLAPKDYKQLFHNSNYNYIKIVLDNEADTELVTNELKLKYNNPKFTITSWTEFNPYMVNALEIQKKIFYFIYIILFTLLCAIIISTNITFFKEKRKDWALYNILEVFPYSVERIFLYKNLISYFITLIIGFGLGALLTIYSNELLSCLLTPKNFEITKTNFFGQSKLTYIFLLSDFTKISLFSFAIFLINFILLMTIFRKESTSSFLQSN